MGYFYKTHLFYLFTVGSMVTVHLPFWRNTSKDILMSSFSPSLSEQPSIPTGLARSFILRHTNPWESFRSLCAEWFRLPESFLINRVFFSVQILYSRQQFHTWYVELYFNDTYNWCILFLVNNVLTRMISFLFKKIIHFSIHASFRFCLPSWL